MHETSAKQSSALTPATTATSSGSLLADNSIRTLSYFKELYPDELLYSTISRYAIHTQDTDARSLNRLFFGSPVRFANYDMPGQLQRFSEILPKSRNLTVERILLEHTLYPYYTAFRNYKERSKICKNMSFSTRTSKIKQNSYAKEPIFLRFCPQCKKEMVHNFGESYWQRSHQLPLVTVCHIHRCPLRYSKVKIIDTKSRYFSASDESCPDKSLDIIDMRRKSVFAKLIRITARSVDILQSRPNFESHAAMRRVYMNALAQKGFQAGSQTLDNKKIRESLNLYYCDLNGIISGIKLPKTLGLGWASDLLNIEISHSSPSLHILMHEFIEHSTDFCPSIKTNKGIGIGPWPCFNPVFAHAQPPDVKLQIINRPNRHGTGRFTCECGYTYTRSWDKQGKFEQPRFLNFGETLRPILAEAIKASWSHNKTATMLGLGIPTVKRQAVLLGMKGFLKTKSTLP